MILSATDSRGRASKTLALVRIGVGALTIKFIIGGITTPWVSFQQTIGAVEFGTAFLLILGPWLKREWDEKIGTKKNES